MPLSSLVERSGCAQKGNDALGVALFGQEYRLSLPGFAVTCSQTGLAPDPLVQALLLIYLLTADGVPPSGRWVAYRDLPGGMFYARAFHGYAECRLVRELEPDGLHLFERAARRLSGVPLRLGDAAYSFRVLPRIHLAAVYWLGDEEMAAQSSVLFEDTSARYMTADGLAVLGSRLVDTLLDAGRAERG